MNSDDANSPCELMQQAALQSFADRIHVLEEIVDDPHAKVSDRLTALDHLARYGGVDQLPLYADDED